MLNASKILLANYDDFAQEMDITGTATALDFTVQYIEPSAVAGKMRDDFDNALTAAADSAFVVGFNAAVRFIMDCMRGGNGQ